MPNVLWWEHPLGHVRAGGTRRLNWESMVWAGEQCSELTLWQRRAYSSPREQTSDSHGLEQQCWWRHSPLTLATIRLRSTTKGPSLKISLGIINTTRLSSDGLTYILDWYSHRFFKNKKHIFCSYKPPTHPLTHPKNIKK